MKSPKNLKRNVVFSTVVLIAVTACVTVNVNFPEGAVQKATDDYVRELYRSKKSTPPAADKTTWLDFLVPSVYAAEKTVEEFKVDSPKTRVIQKRLGSRLDQVLEFKRKGYLGESGDGMLVLKKNAEIKPIQQKMIEKIIVDENKDREELYEEVLKSNNMESQHLKRIKKSFSRSFQAESPSGTWVDNDGKWEQKP
jgi:uncharacterized protein YdbL (DUF1318 family)